jgi:hypothetical protein
MSVRFRHISSQSPCLRPRPFSCDASALDAAVGIKMSSQWKGCCRWAIPRFKPFKPEHSPIRKPFTKAYTQSRVPSQKRSGATMMVAIRTEVGTISYSTILLATLQEKSVILLTKEPVSSLILSNCTSCGIPHSGIPSLLRRQNDENLHHNRSASVGT